ncbi:MAG TPA: DUF58 domain-containing protein [Xanthomonadales bacterium]|nr:DUF58 domain-containing protein [Xanthomonadales bacterium]
MSEQRASIRPAPLFAWAFVAWAAGGALLVAGLVAPVAYWGVGAVLLAIALADARELQAAPTPVLARELPPVVPVGIEREVRLVLRNEHRSPIGVEAHDLHPGDWPVTGLPRALRLRPRSQSAFGYSLVPAARGAFEFGGCALRLRSPLGFWRQRRVAGPRQSVRVLPNFAPLARLAWVGAEQASRVVGAHIRRRRGEGTEFQQLREYREGDALRQIDWKASRRALKLISREYQVERNQQVMLLIDTGRRMLARDGALAHFDHVLNAALMVAYIALRRGDAVGLLAIGGETRFVPPRRGIGAVNALLNSVYDLQARPVATDYLEAATQFGARQPRRSLVLLVTNVRDEDVEDVVAAVHQLSRRHLVCVASLREDVIGTTLARVPATLEDAVTTAAMAMYSEARDRAHNALRARGV